MTNEPRVEPGAAPFTPQVASAKNLATVVYALQAASLLVGITAVVGVVINYLKRAEVRGTWVDSHFGWQIRTFWLSLLFACLLFVGIVLLTVGAVGAGAAGSDAGAAAAGVSAGMLGMVGGLALFVWYLYRVVKGWLRLSDNRPV